jgi:glycerol-3-phosphate dehydrogenase
MTRDPEALTRQRWDLLVVGGGIHGLFAAYDAAQRGLSVALVEALDFGSGLTWNHQRTLHGGLRTLQGGQVAKTRRQIAERRAWAHIAPHLIRPMPFLIGTYRRLFRSRAAIRLGFWAYEMLGRSKNAGVSIELHLPKTRLESRAATRRLFPGIAESGLTGGAIWYDYQTRHPDRLTWLVARAAEQAGATLVNYTCVLGPIRDSDGRVVGVKVRDEIDGREREIHAEQTLIAAGKSGGTLRTAFGAGEGPPLLRAMNVLLDRPGRDIALAAPGRTGRMLTAVSWGGLVLVGTDQSESIIPDGEVAPPSKSVESFLADINFAFPTLAATTNDIRLLHYGLTPARIRGHRAELLPEAEITSHARHGVPGLVSLVGVKFTDARHAAERAVDIISQAAGVRRRCRTASTVLPDAAIADVEGRLVETQRDLGTNLEADVALHLASWYGTEAPAVLRHAAASGLMDRVDSSSPVLRGEVDYAVRHTAALRLADVVMRRTPLGSTGHPGRSALARTAEVMAPLLQWTPERTAQEIVLTEQRYPKKLLTAL